MGPDVLFSILAGVVIALSVIAEAMMTRRWKAMYLALAEENKRLLAAAAFMALCREVAYGMADASNELLDLIDSEVAFELEPGTRNAITSLRGTIERSPRFPAHLIIRTALDRQIDIDNLAEAVLARYKGKAVGPVSNDCEHSNEENRDGCN